MLMLPPAYEKRPEELATLRKKSALECTNRIRPERGVEKDSMTSASAVL